jgi:hypothetical protein
MSDKAEQCFRAKLIDKLYVLDDDITHTEAEFTITRWMNKTHQSCVKSQRQVCCCRPDDHYVFMDLLLRVPFLQDFQYVVAGRHDGSFGALIPGRHIYYKSCLLTIALQCALLG